jgi:hypothetical protein
LDFLLFPKSHEAIFVDDQSHEIKAMHGACRTLQAGGTNLAMILLWVA